MKLKTKLHIENKMILVFFNYTIYLNDTAFAIIDEIDNWIKRKPITENLIKEVHGKLNAGLNFCISSNNLSLWRRCDLPHRISKQKDFSKVRGNVMTTKDIVKPLNHVYITGSVSW